MAFEQDKYILKVEGLAVNYGAVEAVKNVGFDVLQGEIFGLLGPNGAGKTSTLSAIEGLVKFKTGSIVLNGFDVLQQPLQAKASMGVQLQSTSFQAELNVTQILQLFSGIYGVPLSVDGVKTVLKEINLEDAGQKKFSQLSGGQQQRLSLVIATIHNPRLVLLDEPTTGLDPQSRRQLWERIEAIKARGHAVLLTTHSMEEAEAVCDRIAIIDHGRVIAIDTPQGMIDKHRDDPEVVAVSRRGKITLEDVFIGLTGKAVRD
ncbi:ABC transporter ATP-binding protein [Mucilaginibacter sp. dw_454]|uniref:ABC transporter ATP-binding protein n=1 Tax=Mucilaginibacter sp. dw_454 TaxID=2720079 RepID=UPI001BD589EA|nr:ABC transporter ATP-binding protein [Mucilaginibacter sp. dw_454]